MVKIINGVIVSNLESNENNDNSNVNIFGWKLPLWCVGLIVISSFVIGGVPGAIITIVGMGIGYFLNNERNSNTIQVYYHTFSLFLSFSLFHSILLLIER